MLDRLRNDNCINVVDEHLARIAPQLQDIDKRIEGAAAAGDRSGLEALRAMRIYLASGLFVHEFYRRGNPDLQQLSDFELVEHFVRHGEKEGRVPNPVSWPSYSWDDVIILGIHPPCEFEASGRGDQLAVMRVKRMLTRLLARDRAFDCYRRMFGLSSADRIRCKPIGSLRAAAQAQRGAFFEHSAGGEPFRVAAVNVRGEGNQHELGGIARSIFVACLIDARVRGRSAVIETDRVALLDYQEFETAKTGDQLDFDPAVFRTEGDAAWVIEAGGDVLELDEAFTLLGPRSDGFGHWLWEYLPKYVAAVQANALPPVPILIDADMPPVHRAALELLVPQGVRLIELAAFAPARVRRLWCAPSQMYMPVLRDRGRQFRWDCLAAPPERYAALIDQMVRRLDATPASPDRFDKLFLARRDFRHRRLFNEEAIAAMAAERGFHVVDPEHLDLAAQVRLVRDARFIIAPDGPALFLAFFARRGTKLCVLSHPDTAGLTVLSGPLRAIGVDVTVLTGPYIRIGDEYRDGSAYQVDEEAFSAFLPEWRSRAARTAADGSAAARSKRRPLKIGAFISVKDEVEIIARTIDHHRAIGVDPIVVCDVNSTDGTFDILQRYQAQGLCQIIRIEDPDYPEPHVPDALDMLKELGADWVVFVAADEYCIPLSGKLEDCAALADTDLLIVDRFNVALSPGGPLMPQRVVPARHDELLLLFEPVADLANYLQEHPDAPWIRGMDAPAVIARPQRLGGVKPGIHDIVVADRAPLRWSRPSDLFVAHLPLTTLSRFTRKVDNIRRFFAAHDAAQDDFSIPGTTSHWRRWVALANQGLLRQEFDRSVFDMTTIAEMRARGSIRSATEIFREAGGGQPGL